MNTPRFLIAKYAPDLKRMEPRNFGVIVWNDGVVVPKWVEDRAHGLRRLNIGDTHAYKQWIQYWNLQCAKTNVKTRTGKSVSRTSSEFVDILRQTGSGHFLLFDGGRMLDRVPKEQTRDLADELFSELVAEEPKEEEIKEIAESELLRKHAQRVLRRSGLAEREGFRSNGYDLVCPVGDTMQPFHFDYAIHTDKPLAVIQRVHLRKQPTVNNAAFMFEKMQAAYLLRENCAALVYVTPDDMANDHVKQAYRLLESQGRVVNSADEENASNALRSLAI